MNNIQRPKPVLMIPIRRCGSHALRLRLNFSPDFYSPYPLHIVDFMPLMDLYGDLSDDATYFQLVVDLLGLQNATMVKWRFVDLDPVSIFESVKDLPVRSPHVIYWEMLFLAGHQHNAKVVMDKSLDSIYYADDILSLFDDLLFLNVVRDPRSQISSMNKAIIHEFDTLLNTFAWLKANNAARKLIDKYPERVLTVRYEDFINDSKSILQQICQFIGLKFTPAMLDIKKSKDAEKISSLSNLWKTNGSAPIPSYIDKFRKELNQNDIRIIETLTRSHMNYYGYESITAADSEITPEMIDTAKKQSQLKTKRAWEELRKNNPKDYILRKFRSDYINLIRQRFSNAT